MRYVSQLHRPLVIVSNNSEPAIRAYLTQHELSGWVTRVVGRQYGRPDLMKPDPWPITMALSTWSPNGAVMVGDSVTDVMAAHAVGVRCVGFANRPGKRAILLDAGADSVVTAMHDLIKRP
jgi:phosphoglycolate phosphatase